MCIINYMIDIALFPGTWFRALVIVFIFPLSFSTPITSSLFVTISPLQFTLCLPPALHLSLPLSLFFSPSLLRSVYHLLVFLVSTDLSLPSKDFTPSPLDFIVHCTPTLSALLHKSSSSPMLSSIFSSKDFLCLLFGFTSLHPFLGSSLPQHFQIDETDAIIQSSKLLYYS